MNEPSPDLLKKLIKDIHTSAKYRTVCESVIRNIGRHELSIRHSYKDAVKETKNTLHQVAGAYLQGRMRYDRWIDELVDNSDESLKNACRRQMRYHASTRERLPVLSEFYTALFDLLPEPKSICDIGCGLNPLSIPWMPVSPDTVFHVYDIYTDQVDYLNRFFTCCGIRGKATATDIAATPPDAHADLALMFKILPVLDHLPYTNPRTFLQTVNADHMAVSFPTQSLGGKEKGMAAHYEQWFLEMMDNSWEVERMVFETELVFVVRR